MVGHRETRDGCSLQWQNQSDQMVPTCVFVDPGFHHHQQNSKLLPSEPEFWLAVSLCVALVLAAGVMAGSTLGLTSLDPLHLHIKVLEGTETEQRYAKKVLRAIHHRHWMLVTLLLVNAACNEALPIFLNWIMDEQLAIVVSVTCVLFFGEIFPSALMTGPSQLRLGATAAPMVDVLRWVTSPISYPLSKVMNKLVGSSHGLTRFERHEFKALVKLQQAKHGYANRLVFGVGVSTSASEQDASTLDDLARRSSVQPLVSSLAVSDVSPVMDARPLNVSVADPSEFSSDEVKILHSVLDLRFKVAQDLIKEGSLLQNMKAVSADDRVDYFFMDKIFRDGFSRVPVYRGSRHNVIGIFLIKDHIMVDLDRGLLVGELQLRRPLFVSPSTHVLDLLNMFKTGRSHLALVSSEAVRCSSSCQLGHDLPDNSIVGLCTIQDVMEVLIGEQVADEPADLEPNLSHRGYDPDGQRRTTEAKCASLKNSDREALKP